MAKYTKQKNGYYRTKVLLGYGPDGKPKCKYLNARSIRELDDLVMKTKQEQAQGLLLARNVTFGDYASKWLAVYKANRGVATRAMYESVLKNHVDLLARVPLKDVTRLMIQGQINARADRPRTCEMILLTVKQIFKSAIRDGVVLRSPCVDIDLPRHVKNEKRPLTEEEKKALRSSVLLPQERLLLLLLYGTGCRPAEAYALTKSDFDFRAGTVFINKAVQFSGNIPVSVSYPKTDSSIRHVVVSDAVMRALKHLVDKMPHDNVLGGNTGEIMHKCQYGTIFKHILQKSGLSVSGITQYTFRHNFCTECKYNGLSLKETQHQMGHKDYKMILQVYEHIDSLKENTREKMANMVM